MEALKILEKKENVNWDYDEEADVLYLSIGKPRPALGLDAGDGLIVRYDEKTSTVTGLTIMGFRERASSFLEKAPRKKAARG